jgi:hypothetical protein
MRAHEDARRSHHDAMRRGQESMRRGQDDYFRGRAGGDWPRGYPRRSRRGPAASGCGCALLVLLLVAGVAACVLAQDAHVMSVIHQHLNSTTAP